MKLTKWNPTNLFSDFDSFLDPFFSRKDFLGDEMQFNVPAVNVSETDNAFELEMAVPGKSKDDFEITIENNVLTISSEIEDSSETAEKNFTRKEYSYSSFKRSFSLPENVKSDKIDAKYQDGVLKLSIPKTAATVKDAKKIKVA
ncbi:MAG: Hsp20/alpha crystallin family protein [Maribacter sp.]|nr:Hsp20/alpha crystallin family protein [Maribacter sp.]